MVFQFDANRLSLYIAGDLCTRLMADDRGDCNFSFAARWPFEDAIPGLGFLETNAMTVFLLFCPTNFMLLVLFPIALMEEFVSKEF